MAGPGVDLVQVVFDRTALSPSENVAVMTMHCRGVVAGLPDNLNPMDDTNRDNFKTKLDAFFTGVWQSHATANYKVTDYKFYALPAALGTPMGDPAKHYVVSIVGAAGGEMIPQCAVSVTFKTDTRKQWGRFYVPGLYQSAFDPKGRVLSTVCDQLATAAHGLTSRAGTGACLTVWSRTQWTHHDPQTVQVDNVPDVIRSRRFKYTTYRASVAAGT